MFTITDIILKSLQLYLFCYMGVYWLISLVFYFLDKKSMIYVPITNLKIQPEKMIDFNKYHQTMFNVFLNQILSIPFLIIPISLIYYIGNDMSLTIPSYWILSKHIVLSLLIFDIIFFVSHYFSHCGYLYKYFHKIHHEWPSPVAVAAHYNHFIEHLILNIFAPAISIIIIGANYFTMCLWFIIATIAAH